MGWIVKIHPLKSYISISDCCVHKYAVTHSSFKHCHKNVYQRGFWSQYINADWKISRYMPYTRTIRVKSQINLGVPHSAKAN